MGHTARELDRIHRAGKVMDELEKHASGWTQRELGARALDIVDKEMSLAWVESLGAPRG